MATAKAVHHHAHLLLAARTLDDVNVFAVPQEHGKGRFTVPVIGKWGISFVMSGNVVKGVDHDGSVAGANVPQLRPRDSRVSTCVSTSVRPTLMMTSTRMAA